MVPPISMVDKAMVSKLFSYMVNKGMIGCVDDGAGGWRLESKNSKNMRRSIFVCSLSVVLLPN
jgi:hypothetical protein